MKLLRVCGFHRDFPDGGFGNFQDYPISHVSISPLGYQVIAEGVQGA
jgi:hypothetical protein